MENNQSPREATRALIGKLSATLTPVRVRSLRFLTFQYFVTLTVAVGAFIAVTGNSLDVFQRADRILYVVWFTLNLIAGSFLLARYSRPGGNPPKLISKLFLSALAFTSIAQLIRFAIRSGTESWGEPLGHGWGCAQVALGVALVTTGLLLVQMRRQAPVSPGPTVIFVQLCVAMAGAFVLVFHCPNDNPMHQLLWHGVIPLIILILFTTLVGRRSLRW